MKRVLSFFLVLSTLVLVGQGCFGGGATETGDQVLLRYWRVFDGEDTMRGIIDAYQASRPNVRIEYRRLRFDEYEDELIKAFAEDRGPDIFSIQNTKIEEYLPLIEPMPEQVTITVRERRNQLSQETVVVPRTFPMPTLRQYENSFLETVYKDTVRPIQTAQGTVEKIVGIPLSVDTLALYYNRDLLSATGIPQPAETWTQLQEQVPLLTTYDENGEIVQSGVAMGTGSNVDRSPDILSLIMMQLGAVMTDSRGRVTFANRQEIGGVDRLPALNALSFYTDFANPQKETYAWNDSFSSSLDAFTSGQSAYFFGYSYHDPLIRSASPRLNYRVREMLQLEGNVRKVNFANYWIETVAKNSENQNWAWDFVNFATSADQVIKYLDSANKPTARLDLIGSQVDDNFLAPFANQLLTAESWYRGGNADQMENAFIDMADNFLSAPEPQRYIEQVQRQVSSSY